MRPGLRKSDVVERFGNNAVTSAAIDRADDSGVRCQPDSLPLGSMKMPVELATAEPEAKPTDAARTSVQ